MESLFSKLAHGWLSSFATKWIGEREGEGGGVKQENNNKYDL